MAVRGATEGTFSTASTVRHTSTACLKSVALFPLNGSPSLHPGRNKRGCLSREVRPCTAAMLSAPGADSRKCANGMQKRVFLGRTSDWVGDFSSSQKERTARYKSGAKSTCATAEQLKIEENLALAARRVLSPKPTCLQFEPSAMLRHMAQSYQLEPAWPAPFALFLQVLPDCCITSACNAFGGPPGVAFPACFISKNFPYKDCAIFARP